MARRSDRSDERPRRRKKNRAIKSTRRYWVLGGVLGGVALLGLLVVAAVLLRPHFGAKKLTAPEHFVVYNSPEDVFHVSMPKGWALQSGGRKNQYRVSAEKGPASIQVYES